MEFLICDEDRMEISVLSDYMGVDMAIGDTNDVELACQRSDDIASGMYLICPGTEYGARLEDISLTTNSEDVTWSGPCFRRFLEQIIIEPPSGQDYRIVSGDANDIIRDLIGGKLDGMFDIPDTSSGITISNYQFSRYVDALAGLTAMLDEHDARINIEIKAGGSNEAFTVELSAVPVRNMSAEIEYSQDETISITLEQTKSGITHLICLGQGELAERTVIHLYLQADGSIGTKQYYTGIWERAAVYDYSSAEDDEELTRGGEERLKELAPGKNMEMTVEGDIGLEIGDIIAGRDYKYGLYLEKPITKKIVKVESGVTNIEYQVEGND